MSKKNNKKSAKKKVSPKRSSGTKKPVKSKTAGKSRGKKAASKPAKKKPVKKAPTAKKKPVKKKIAPKKKIVKKTAKKKVAKKVAKKAAPKKAAKKIVFKPSSSAGKKAIKVAKPAPAKPSSSAGKKAPVKEVKPESKPIIAKPAENQAAPAQKAVKVKAVKRVVKSTPVTPPRKSVPIDIKIGPEPAGKFELEYVVHASSQSLFEFLTSPSGLSEWFCDDVNIRNGVYSFKWEENEQNARVVKLIEEKLVRFQWVDKHDNSYFEFRIERDELTNDISLIIVDFAETPEEKASSTLLWNSQIDKLLHVLGAYF